MLVKHSLSNLGPLFTFVLLESHEIAQAGVGLVTLLPQPSK